MGYHGKMPRHAAALSLAMAALIPFSGTVAQAAPEKPLAKNVIVMISDGAGYNQVDAASYYQYGRTGKQIYERFPFRFGMSTYSDGTTKNFDPLGYDPAEAWADFEYVSHAPTDSASAGTAMATGSKTYDAAIGVGVKGNPLRNIIQSAEDLGKATGVVTSVEFSHATPASFVAHNASRNNYEAIAQEMLLGSSVDVIMGAGHPGFTDSGEASTPSSSSYKYVGGKATWDDLAAGTAGADANGDGVADPWTLVQSKEQFRALMSGDTADRVVGVAQVATTLQQARGGDGKADPYAVPANSNVPTLAEMTRAALNVLDNDKDGFFLMVEGGAVDWAGHANQSGRVIEEQIDFNRAVEAVAEWVQTTSNWGETVLIVTGDHETGYLTGPASGIDGTPVWNPLANNGAGKLPGMEWHSGDHTNSLIPLFAKGDAARLLKRYAVQTDPVRGRYIDNTELGRMLFQIFR